MENSPKALILLSGGLDSLTVLAIAQNKGYSCHALSFDYGQRHWAELNAAKKIAQHYQKPQEILPLPLNQFGASSLTDCHLKVPTDGDFNFEKNGIPNTYVPARNTVFLAVALACAEAQKIPNIFIGINAVDFSGYPDCRPIFLNAFQNLANVATDFPIQIHAPLLNLSKANIIQTGTRLGVDYALSVSCYQADKNGFACGVCDSCRLRRQGFVDANIADPTPYQKTAQQRIF